MNYRNRSVRCVHKMCLTTVGCEECGIKPKRGAGYHLRRPETHAAPRVVPSGYNAAGKRSGEGNSNATGGGR